MSATDRADGPEPVWAVGIRMLAAFVRVATRTKVTGLANLPPRGPAIVVANHVSYLDPVVLVVLAHRRGRKMRILGSREAFERPVSGWWIRAGRHIPVGPGADGLLAIRLATAALDRGDLVLIYPEGTIPGVEPVRAARGGAGLLALSSGVPVIPVASAGLERGAARWWQRRQVRVVVGLPVDLGDLAGATGRDRYARASDLMLAAIRRLRPPPPR